MVGWLDGCSVRRSGGQSVLVILVAWLVGGQAGGRVGGLVGWWVGHSVGWLVGCLVNDATLASRPNCPGYREIVETIAHHPVGSFRPKAYLSFLVSLQVVKLARIPFKLRSSGQIGCSSNRNCLLPEFKHGVVSS